MKWNGRKKQFGGRIATIVKDWSWRKGGRNVKDDSRFCFEHLNVCTTSGKLEEEQVYDDGRTELRVCIWTCYIWEAC